MQYVPDGHPLKAVCCGILFLSFLGNCESLAGKTGDSQFPRNDKQISVPP